MKFFLKTLSYLLCVHLLGLLVMSVFRLAFFNSVSPLLPPDVAEHTDWILTAFVRGVWFDNVIACYLMALPLAVAVVAGVCNWWRAGLFRAFNVWFGTLYALVFMASAGNIPYYAYFTKLLNASIWNWAEYGGTTLGMIFGEASYRAYILAFFAATLLFGASLYLLRTRVFGFTARRMRSAKPSPVRAWQRAGIAWVGAAVLGGCILGIRGRLGYNPIKVSAAYFCTNPVLNNLGVNPMFCLLTSTLDEMRPENKKLHLLPPEEAIRQVQQFYGRKGIPGISPIARQVVPQGEPTRQNVVIVLMESLSAQLMGRFGNTRELTPCLDSLYRHSLSFANCYSAGNHTNHGLYATLYSFPSIMFRNAMKGSNIPNYSGLPTVLKQNGYSTLFFMTHESQYDNMKGFLLTNGYDEIYAQEDYPRSKVVNHFGVPDDYLFTYALPVLRRHAAQGKPFMATLLTISNHPPYVVPKEFQTPGLTPEEQIVRYSDDCIRRFMAEAGKEDWAKHTLFVFLGDHGKLIGKPDCELPESFNHIPLIIHADGLQAQERTDFAGQVDVAPTLLGLLRIPYVQNNLGIDLLSEQRPAAFYTADKTIAARDGKRLYVYNAETEKEYFYNLKDGKPVETQHSPEFSTLKGYVFALLQATEQLVQNGQTLDHRKP